jgi:hypothetical protein
MRTLFVRLGGSRGGAGLKRRLIHHGWELDAATLRPRESVMAKSKDQEVVSSLCQPHRALLFELKGEQTAEDGSASTTSTEIFAALSMEEVIAYVRNRQPAVEILELKVLGKVQVLSSSEHL